MGETGAGCDWDEGIVPLRLARSKTDQGYTMPDEDWSEWHQATPQEIVRFASKRTRSSVLLSPGSDEMPLAEDLDPLV
jgi:hypothetical protein